MPVDSLKELEILTSTVAVCLLLFDELETKWTICLLSLVLARILIDSSAAVEFVQVEIPAALRIYNCAHADALRAATALKWIGLSIFAH
jgi:hypothetical protein